MFYELIISIQRANDSKNINEEIFLISQLLKFRNFSTNHHYKNSLGRLKDLAKTNPIAANNLGLHHAENFYLSIKNHADKPLHSRDNDQQELSNARHHLMYAAMQGNALAANTFALLIDFKVASQEDYFEPLNRLLANIANMDKKKDRRRFTSISETANLIYIQWKHSKEKDWTTATPKNKQRFLCAMKKNNWFRDLEVDSATATYRLQERADNFLKFNVNNPPTL